MTKFFPVAYLKDKKTKLYLAFLNEKPIGAGMSICTEGVASLRDMCTLDEYRGRSVATTLTHRILQDARENGCPLAMLYSTAQAYNIYNRLGFEIYTQRQWFLPPDVDYED
jgi:predicted GNAT family acetyltransferase